MPLSPPALPPNLKGKRAARGDVRKERPLVKYPEHETYARFRACFFRVTGRNSRGLVDWIADSMGVHKRTVAFWRTDGLPTYALAVVELLEASEPSNWPDRWRIDHSKPSNGSSS